MVPWTIVFHVLIRLFCFCVDGRRCLMMSRTPWRRKRGFVAQALPCLFLPACELFPLTGFSSWSGAEEATAGKELSVPSQDLQLHALHYLPHPVVRGDWQTTRTCTHDCTPQNGWQKEICVKYHLSFSSLLWESVQYVVHKVYVMHKDQFGTINPLIAHTKFGLGQSLDCQHKVRVWAQAFLRLS